MQKLNSNCNVRVLLNHLLPFTTKIKYTPIEIVVSFVKKKRTSRALISN